jgi:hypothetical protein
MDKTAFIDGFLYRQFLCLEFRTADIAWELHVVPHISQKELKCNSRTESTSEHKVSQPTHLDLQT